MNKHIYLDENGVLHFRGFATVLMLPIVGAIVIVMAGIGIMLLVASPFIAAAKLGRWLGKGPSGRKPKTEGIAA